MRQTALALTLGILTALTTLAKDEPATDPLAAIASQLKYQEGDITLKDGLAKISLPKDLRYLDQKQAQIVLEKLWGNPDGSWTMGMLVPAGISPLDDESWGVIISYEESGYVSDADAEKINYDDLLKSMQQSTRERNAEREKAGYEPIDLVGWAKKPFYDKEAKKMYWAKELKFGGAKEHTLNYDIRVLGRKGVMVLSAVASMKQLPTIEQNNDKILASISFLEGSRYADFQPGTDKVAAYGLAALVAGGVAAKAGFFKGLLVAILAMKKLIIIGVIGLGALGAKLYNSWTGRKTAE